MPSNVKINGQSITVGDDNEILVNGVPVKITSVEEEVEAPWWFVIIFCGFAMVGMFDVAVWLINQITAYIS